MSLNSSRVSRRSLLIAGGGAIAGAAIFPFGNALGGKTAKYTRHNIASERGKGALKSFKSAIRTMLSLPPSDPRNWYRIALTHTMDCPHGNWWFLPWHRGYLGWFEQMCRHLCGDPTFAIPYWDWTSEPRVPDAMFEDNLTPESDQFLATIAEFKAQFEPVMSNFWGQLSADQREQLLNRGLRFPADLWYDIYDDPRGKLFFDSAHARGLTRTQPGFDAMTAKAVSRAMLLDALSPRDFLAFASPKALSHSSLTGFAILEHEPHNNVHNNVGGITRTIDANGKPIRTDVGGFMQAFLSPVDPLFFLHHSNIDRLWDVWTRKQTALSLPIYPSADQGENASRSDFAAWSSEPFLFFSSAFGQPVKKIEAGDYVKIGDFDYDYEIGSGEEVIPTVTSLSLKTDTTSFAASIQNAVGGSESATATVKIPPSIILRSESRAGFPRLFARITLSLSQNWHRDFAVLVDVSTDVNVRNPSDPHFAGTLSIFGHHHHMGPVSFLVPLSTTLAALTSIRSLDSEAPITLRIVPLAAVSTAGQTSTMAYKLISVFVEQH